MRTNKQILKDDFDVEYNKDNTILSKDVCFCSLASDYSNEKGITLDDPKFDLLQDFGFWLESLFEVCDGVKGRIAYREN